MLSTPLAIVDRVYGEHDVPDEARDFALQTVTLGWDERTRTRGRRRTDDGCEFGTALPRGTVLRSGDRLVIAAARIVAVVVERAEAVFVIQPSSPEQWASFAYHIGNRHQPLMITADALVCPDLPGIEAVLEQYRMPYRRATQPFTPAAPAGHGS